VTRGVAVDQHARGADPHATNPSSHRRALTARDQAFGVVFALWMVVGLFLDGWAHDNNEPESFFTPWHGVLYSGFLSAAGAAVFLARPRDGKTWRESMPNGHGLTLAGLGVFAIGAVSDLIWHETLGVEVGVEALLSPTHLLLLVGGIAALSAPFRASWTSMSDRHESLRTFAPTVLSLALLVAVVGFFLLFLSPFVNDTAGVRFDRDPQLDHDHPSSDIGELQQLLGIASIFTTTVLLVVPVLLVLRRWRPPAGSFTLFVTVVVTLFIGLAEFDQVGLIPAGILGGAAADFAVRRGHSNLAAAVMTTVVWLSYFGLYALTVGTVAWPAELWLGSVAMATLIAAALTLPSGRDVPAVEWAHRDRNPKADVRS
ncbi:MAG: hypothetical protein OSA99_18890, partial [Acidimicrobiales bacterium]|nr:hypothetical protein [Acidimicrobiales bacterium]